MSGISNMFLRAVCAGPAFAFWLMAAVPVLYAQASAGYASIGGGVADPSGAAVPNTEISVRNTETNTVRTTHSNAAGRYEVVALQPGEYEITASKSGFATLQRTGVTVSVGQKAVVDLGLTLSAAAETVTISANSPAVETDKTEVSTVINLKDMLSLPLNGRRWDAFVMTTPGVSNDGGFGLLTFRGISGLYNNNMIDGMDNNQAFFSEAKGRTRLAYGISSEAIQEFQVGASNFSPQYGRAAGGIVNSVTKSGANDTHGAFLYLIRDESLNAANSVGGPALIALGLPPKPKDRRQQFGPSVGGAIKKNKLFYFLSYDQQKRTFPAVVVPSAPTFLTSTSTCTAPGCANAIAFYSGLQGPQSRDGDQWLGLSRVDWNATSRHQISSTVNILRWDSANGIQTAPTHNQHASANGSDIVKNETVITRWTWIMRPDFVSELRFQWGRDFEAQEPNSAGPLVRVTNGIDFGMREFLPRAKYPDERRWQMSQNLSWLRGRHSFKFGYDVNWVRDELIQLQTVGGFYNYATLNDLVLDCANLSLPLAACNATPTIGPQGITGKHYNSYTQQFDTLGLAGAAKFGNQDYGLYFEDSFKPLGSLTLNVGLRYDLETMPAPLSPGLTVPGADHINTDKNNFGPRFGLAWDPFKSQKTVLRLGAGAFYGRTQNSTISSLLKENGLRQKNFVFQPGTTGSPLFPNVLSGLPQGSSSQPEAFFAARDFANPVTYQMEFSIEQEIFRNFTLTVTALSTRGQRLPTFRDVNLFPPGAGTYTVCGVPQAGSSTACPQVERTVTVPFFPGPGTNRPSPAFGRLTVVESVVNSWYNGLVIQARHRFSGGFQMQAAFTLSKAQDSNQSSQTFFPDVVNDAIRLPLNPLNLRDEYALSVLDQRKRFTTAAFWQPSVSRIASRPLRTVLDGFQLSGILTLADGRPYSPMISGSPIPAGVSLGVLGAGGSTRVPWVGRDVLTSPGLATVDLRLAREIKVSERLRWNLIAESFNLFNRVNVSSINTTQYNVRGTVFFPRTDFQSISATGTNLTRERQLQLGTRFSF